MKNHHHHHHHHHHDHDHDQGHQMAIPHLFMCPISLDLFTDPVTLCTGQTYDRPNIEKWLAAGNLTCPVTMQRLHDISVVPNHTLRHLIDQWLLIDGRTQLHQDDHYYLAALKHNLESHQTPHETKVQLLERLRVLIEESPNNPRLIQLGFLPSLLNLVFERFVEENNVKIIEQALVCVLKLIPLGEKGCLNLLIEDSKLASFLVLFRHRNATNAIKTSLCNLVEAMWLNSETKELCEMLGGRIIHEMVLMIQHNISEASDAALRAISALCSAQANCENLVSEGAVNGLITYISNNTEKSRSRSRSRKSLLAPLAVATLEQLLAVEGAKEALISDPNGIYALVKMVFKVSDHEGSESAVSSLMIVCYESLEAREKAISAGVLTQLLLLLQSQCNSRTKTKARMLLKLLKSKCAEDTKNVCRCK